MLKSEEQRFINTYIFFNFPSPMYGNGMTKYRFVFCQIVAIMWLDAPAFCV